MKRLLLDPLRERLRVRLLGEFEKRDFFWRNPRREELLLSIYNYSLNFIVAVLLINPIIELTFYCDPNIIVFI